MTGNIKSEHTKSMTFSEWGKNYLELEDVKRLRSYQDRKEIMEYHLVPFFGKTLLPDIRPEDIERYRGQRTKKNGKTAKLQPINNDHIILKHCLNVARRKGLLTLNPASLVLVPNAHNERDVC